jgi:hypothetical protein
MILKEQMQLVAKGGTEPTRVKVEITNSSRMMRYVMIDIGFPKNRVVTQRHLGPFAFAEFETILAPEMEIRMRQRIGKDVNVEVEIL